MCNTHVNVLYLVFHRNRYIGRKALHKRNTTKVLNKIHRQIITHKHTQRPFEITLSIDKHQSIYVRTFLIVSVQSQLAITWHSNRVHGKMSTI